MEIKTAWLVLALGLCATGCRHHAPANTWIQGDSDERWATVARQLRGLDVGMVEMGYRYQELYWAGMDGNWGYADYQLTKIKLTLENALERRPKRRASAEALFHASLSEMSRAVTAEERRGFAAAFAGLTVACNSCHRAEGVASFRVEEPSDRPSPIRGP